METVVGLRAAGYRAALVAHPEGELRRRMEEGPDVVPLAPRHDVDLAAAWQLSRAIRQLQPEVIHAHDSHAVAMAALALSITAPVPRPPIVVSRRLELRIANHSFSKWKYSQADAFIATCESIADRLVKDGIPRHKTRIVHDGVDVDWVRRLQTGHVHAEFFLPTGAPIVGTMTALLPHKGHRYLIDAAALVVRDVPDARFVIIGDGETRPQLEEQIRRLHLERHVFLAGLRSNALELVKGFDFFVLSSISEGMSLTLVDAMAASKPAVATNAGGIPEVVVDGRTGYLVPPRDPPAMAARIVELLENQGLRTTMGAAALARVRQHFTIERMVDGTVEVYRSLVAGTARRPAAG